MSFNPGYPSLFSDPLYATDSLCRLGHGKGQGEIENSQIQLMACLELPSRMLTVDVHGCEDAAGSDRGSRRP